MPGGAATAPPPIDASLVVRLLEERLPQWAGLPVRPVAVQGHDNRTFRVGDAWAVRLPSAERYAARLAEEVVWLPRLAPLLPLPIPVPLALCEPAHGYPWRWSIYRWLPGESTSVAEIPDRARFARDLAGFLSALWSIDGRGGPSPGPDNFHRGGDLAVYDTETLACLRGSRDLATANRAASVWERALAARGPAPTVWVHGDVSPANLLVAAGRLAGVVDFGQLAVGDPACDAAIASTFFAGESRAAFRSALDIDSATWDRARGWCLWKTLLALAQAPHAACARRTLEALLDDD
jgi:aminoglycoside phosphotransferase (APT) family kinase protein